MIFFSIVLALKYCIHRMLPCSGKKKTNKEKGTDGIASLLLLKDFCIIQSAEVYSARLSIHNVPLKMLY